MQNKIHIYIVIYIVGLNFILIHELEESGAHRLLVRWTQCASDFSRCHFQFGECVFCFGSLSINFPGFGLLLLREFVLCGRN